MDSVKLRLSQLEDIQLLVASGDVVLARELFLTLQTTGGNRDTNSNNSAFPFDATVATRSSWNGTRNPPLPLFSSTPQPTSRALLTASPSPEEVPSSFDDVAVATTSVAMSDRTRVMLNGDDTMQHQHNGVHDLFALSNSNRSQLDLTAPPLLTSSSSPSAASVAEERRKRIMKLRKQSASYPACLLLKLETVHKFDGNLRASIGDLDDAIRQAEEDVRQTHREIRRQEVLFQRLEPGEGYIARDFKSIHERIEEEKLTLANERSVLREKLAQSVDHQNAMKDTIEQLQHKLQLLMKHLESVRDAVADDRQMMRETFPALTDEELFQSLTSVDIQKLIDVKKHMIKEQRQYLWKKRNKNQHSIVSVRHQVEKKQKELDELKCQAVLLAECASPSPAVRQPEETTHDDKEVSIVCDDEQSPFSWVPKSTAELPPPPEESPPQPPQSNDGTAKKPSNNKPPAQSKPVTSIALLTVLDANAKKKVQEDVAPLLEGSKVALPANRLLRDKALHAIQKKCFDNEREARHQIHVIFTESLNLLAKKKEIERLGIMEEHLMRIKSAHQSVQRSPGRRRLPAASTSPTPARSRQETEAHPATSHHHHDNNYGDSVADAMVTRQSVVREDDNEDGGRGSALVATTLTRTSSEGDTPRGDAEGISNIEVDGDE